MPKTPICTDGVTRTFSSRVTWTSKAYGHPKGAGTVYTFADVFTRSLKKKKYTGAAPDASAAPGS